MEGRGVLGCLAMGKKREETRGERVETKRMEIEKRKQKEKN